MDSGKRPAPKERIAPRADALREKIAADTGVEIAPIRDASATQIAAATAKSTARVVLREALLRGRIAADVLAKLGLPALGAAPIFSIPVVGLLLTVVALVVKIAARAALKLAMPGVSAVSLVKRLIARRRDARRRRRRRET